MRKYPKKCPKCKEYGVPVFNSVHDMSLRMGFQHDINRQPIHWFCEKCNKNFNYADEHDIE